MLVLEQVRCPNCQKLLANLSGQAQIKCPRCKAVVHIDTDMRKVYIKENPKK